MANYTRKETYVDPYWDDFESYRNFLRMTFNPKRAVQARELTQLQTIAQNQLENMASHIFADGSSVIGARIEVTHDAPYIEIPITEVHQLGSTTDIDDPQKLVGQHIQFYDTVATSTSGAMAEVVAVDNNAGTLRIQLDMRGGLFVVTDKWASVDYKDDDAADYKDDATGPGNIGYKYEATTGITAIGTCLRARLEAGTVWLNGFFVEVQPQEIFITKTGESGTFVIGYEFEEITLDYQNTTQLDPIDNVTELGPTLRDPAGTTNQGAPGADRYMVDIQLKSYTEGSVPDLDIFHQVVKMTDGVIEEKVEKTQYADILDMLAGRTYDESGHYTVEPYTLLAEWLDGSNFNYKVGPGKSYAFGYERENIVPISLSATKTRTDLRSYDPENRSALYGTYVEQLAAPGFHTFANTDIATNELTIGAHGFVTGDRVRYDQGSGTAITNLTDNTVYWVIEVDENTIELASSLANAQAGTGLAISGGSGLDYTVTYNSYGFDPTAFDTVYLMSGYAGQGSLVGTAKIWFADDSAGSVRYFIGDNPTLNSDLQGTKSLCAVSTGSPSASDAYINIEEFSVANAVGFNQPILQLAPFVKEVTAVAHPTLLKISNTITAADFSLNTGSDNDTFFADETESIAFIAKSTGEVYFASDEPFGASPTGGGTREITTASHNLPAGTYDFYMNINRELATKRVKTLTEASYFDVTFTTAGTNIRLDTTQNGGANAVLPGYFDVSAIESIIEDPTVTPIDVTENFTLDDGQKDLFYDYAEINGTFEISKTYRITLHYWAWSTATGTGDFFTANSYARGSDDWYDDKGNYESHIPVFTNDQNTKTWMLRDCIDFRRNITEINSAREIAAPSGTVAVTYDHYLPRQDKIWLDRDGKLGVTEGVAEEIPRLPPDKSGTVTLFTTYVLPYLYDPWGTDTHYDSDQVNIQLIDHKNFTMDDIRKLENRIRGLEYYSSEVQLELDAYADTVLDVDGLARSKNGFFVDKFNNHNKGSVWNLNYRCAMDPIEGALHCPFEMNHVQLEYDTTPAAAGTQTNITEDDATPWDHVITLDVSSTPKYVEQPLATEYMNINPFAVVVWAGEIVMDPWSDTWVETQWAPSLQIQDPEEAARIIALYEREDVGIPLWGAWETQVIGVDNASRRWNRRSTAEERAETGSWRVEFTAETTSTTSQSTRTGTVVEQSGSEVVSKDMGERTLDISSIPWMREIEIEFEGQGMRPDAAVVPYFSEEDVSAQVVWDGANPGGVAKKNGSVKGTFTVPQKKFRTGKNVFSLKDRLVDPLSLASAEFRAEGTLYTKAREILSVEVPTYSTRTISEIASSVSTEEEITNTRWYDPIAQTFLIEDEGGVFLDSIDIFFATKDRYVPVSLHIVETIAGVPGQKVVPFSRVVKEADDVTATRWVGDPDNEVVYNGDHYNTEGTVLAYADGTAVAGAPTDFVATNFKFGDPIYLKEGVEYAFVLVSNSNNYNAYISRMGQFDIISGFGVTKQPHLGSLMKSQNTSTWTPDQYADIKFQINRCDFDTGPSALYMRVKGTHSEYSAVATYSIGDQVIYDHGTDGLGIYECIVATSAGQNPTTNPTSWSRLSDGFYNATMLNISTDELQVPGTSIIRQYLLGNDTTWLNYTNKENIDLASQATVELYPDALGVNLKLQFKSDSTWLSPIINKGRSFAVLVNNLVRDTDADAPASHALKKDSGEYISDTTVLKENAASMKLMIDVKKPDADAIIVPKYRTVKEDIRYVSKDDALTDSENLFSLHQAMKDNFAYVYHVDADIDTGGASVVTWDQQGDVIVDGFEVNTVTPDDSKIYLSSIANPADFGAKASVVGGTNNWILITTEPDMIDTDVTIWDGSAVALNDYVVNPNDKNIYRSEIASNTSTPSDNGTDWTLIPGVWVDGAVAFESDVEWRPMTQISNVNTSVDTTQFVEYEFEPTVSPSEEFDNFAVKIEMYSGDAVNVPVCKRLRVIAVN